MKTRQKTIILVAIAVVAMATLIQVNLQHVRGAAAQWQPPVISTGASPDDDLNRVPVRT